MLIMNFIDHLSRSGTAMLLWSISLGALLMSPPAAGRGIAIPEVRSGRATLHQQGRLTVLEIKASSGVLQRIGLTHPSDYLQTANPPNDAELIAESPGHFLIFTDSFVSNPGNVQGNCGAPGEEERFVHVVALGAIPHETLSVLMSSCLSLLVASSRSPEWIAETDSANFAGRIVMSFDGSPSVSYYVARDGAVTRPEVEEHR